MNKKGNDVKGRQHAILCRIRFTEMKAGWRQYRIRRLIEFHSTLVRKKLRIGCVKLGDNHALVLKTSVVGLN